VKIYEIVFKFMDPSTAMGTIAADSAEEAIEKIKADLAENSPGITDFEVVEVREVLDAPNLAAEDIDSDRTLN